MKWTSLLILFIISCSAESGKNSSGSIFPKYDQTKAVLIVPMDGCSSCSRDVLNRVNDLKGLNTIEIILTGLVRKEIEIALKEHGLGLGERLRIEDSRKLQGYIGQRMPVIVYLRPKEPHEVVQLNGENVEEKMLVLKSSLSRWKSGSKACGVYEVEELPMYKGGDQAFNDFISQIVEFPEDATEVKAIVEFEVSETGQITEVVVLRDNGCCGDGFVEKLKSSPFWKPAQKDGKPVATRLYLPIKIK